MKIYDVTDERFRKYGRVIENIDFSELTDAMAKTPVPDDVVYEPCIPEFMQLPVAEEICRVFFGELPIQIGYCNGHNTKLNAVEYHRSSEINVAATDAILMLGLEADIKWDENSGSDAQITYDTAQMEAFLIPKKTAVELYATTLHYAPCHVAEDGFQVSVILPAGTNTPLEEVHGYDKGEDALITAKNKWLIGHAEGGLPEGSYIGLSGKNLDVTEE